MKVELSPSNRRFSIKALSIFIHTNGHINQFKKIKKRSKIDMRFVKNNLPISRSFSTEFT
ncbi:hypothetical protein PCE01_05470 [Pediococcus cellicola]|nr:hypothetical protein PCE01_05470 [Pediococcus cellicola]